MIQVEGLRKYFRMGFFLKKKWVLNGVNLTVNPTDIFALVGPNGAGKTTLLLCLMGFLDINEGKVRVFDKETGDISIFHRISYLPELPTIPKHLNAMEFMRIDCGLNYLKVTDTEIIEWLEKVNLADERKKMIAKFSKGMVQRLAIAAAFIKDCDIYFLDEPILGLDPLGIKFMRDLILEKQKQGKTVFLNSHILSEVEKTATKIAVMKDGKIILEKKIEELQGKILKIKVKDISEESLIKIKNSISFTPELENGNLIYRDVKEDAVPEIIRKISREIDIFDVRFLKESIEEIFIKHVSVN